MYLNIVLTLILLVFTGNLWANLSYRTRQEKKQNEVYTKQDELNYRMLLLHSEMLKELIKLNEVKNDLVE